MCGISGIYLFDPKAVVDIHQLKRMTDTIRHRGPDDEGYLLIDRAAGKACSFSGPQSTDEARQLCPLLSAPASASLGLGFRRLSTLELSQAGHQPMHDEALGLSVTFNGEIYNYQELLRELTALGYGFTGHSDTEVILKAYHHWGDACVDHFIGMWAFVIWDQKKQRLFISRDRFGIKPFYYAKTDKGLFWGSEMKQFLDLPIDKSLNYPMIWRSMKINSLLVYGEETFWKGIRALKPGHNMIVSDREITTHAYYEIDTAAFGKSGLSFERAVETYRGLFEDSLSLHLRSDVEIAASLSGGMDSSAIVCSAHRQSGHGLRTFSSFYSDDPALDERKWIDLIVGQTGSQPYYVSPEAQDAWDWLDKVTYYNDLPTRAGYTSQWAVMHSVREQGIKVLLSGQGSDELFAGYRHSAYRYFADQIRSGRFGILQKELRDYLSGDKPGTMGAKLGKVLLSALLPESSLYKLEFSHYRFEPFNRDFIEQARTAASGGILGQIHDIKGSRLDNFLLNMLHSTSIQTLLHLEDRMSSANSVESRVPFLDHRLVDFAFSLPAEYKIKPPMHKYIHREAMKEIVPREIYERRDKGIFSSPFFSTWMRGPLKPYIEEIVHSSEFRRRNLWNLPVIHRKWKEYLSGKQAPAEMLFNVLAQEIWFRRFCDNK